MINVKDIVYHFLSKLYFYCENEKHKNWMNENKYYRKALPNDIFNLPINYFKKH